MRLVWSDRSLRDLAEINSYLQPRNRIAAGRMISRLRSVVRDVLLTTPKAGRPGRVEATRELVVTGTPYVVAYQVADEAVTILAVVHSARRWPTSF